MHCFLTPKKDSGQFPRKILKVSGNIVVICRVCLHKTTWCQGRIPRACFVPAYLVTVLVLSHECHIPMQPMYPISPQAKVTWTKCHANIVILSLVKHLTPATERDLCLPRVHCLSNPFLDLNTESQSVLAKH